MNLRKSNDFHLRLQLSFGLLMSLPTGPLGWAPVIPAWLLRTSASVFFFQKGLLELFTSTVRAGSCILVSDAAFHL